ncbi:MAG TPA: TonB-dependent receptor [Usitatibacter sp.]|nr:TonB-dependent receptor [Usitatibacter sp.]
MSAFAIPRTAIRHLAGCGIAVAGSALAAPQPSPGLEDLTLEQLTEIRVTSASRREERLASVPASVYVITADDIRRAGASNIVDVLRLAPNLFVGRSDASQAVIGARGQYAGTSNKMLVLVDGRTIYTPLFSGVFWDAQQLVIEDIERIEVISGPAATLWGTNGVNGVINITTRSARQTTGTLASAFGGNLERGLVARQGGTLAGDGSYRIFAKYRETDERRLENGAPAHDSSHRATAGLRADWESPAHTATVEAQVYRADVDNIGGDRDLSGGHLLARWSQPAGRDASIRLQAYYDRTERTHAGSFEEKLDILDLEVQHDWQLRPTYRVVSGAGYRLARDDIMNTPVIGFDPAHRSLWWASAFVQGEWSATPQLQLTAGLRGERNPYTGLEWLPNLRFAWRTAHDHLVWGALSRAIRAPSRIDREAFTPALRTNDTFDSEVADVAEIGYRAQLSPSVNVSLTAFHQRYPNLRSAEPTADGNVVFANGFEGRSSGVEGWGTWRLMPWWRLTGGFTVMTETIRLRSGFTDVGGVTVISNDPRHTAQLRSSWDIGRAWEADLAVRRVGHVPNFDIPATTVVDSRIAWRITPRVDASLVVQNLLDRDDVEFGAGPDARVAFRRSYFLRLRWQV